MFNIDFLKLLLAGQLLLVVVLWVIVYIKIKIRNKKYDKRVSERSVV